ncbi:MAG: protein phosphatase CheZ [Gammaproteobacteria bacterium]|nr:protein phosphatase CheZ [Gammaproteobacteria bacterium]
MSDENKSNSQDMSDFEVELREQTANLTKAIESGRFSDALVMINNLNQIRDKSLYREVGKLTRTLHQAIRNFHIDGYNQQQREELSVMTDASDRLAYVVKMTNDAANKTMDLVESTMPVAASIRDEAAAIKVEWERLRKRELTPDEFRDLYKRIDEFMVLLQDQSANVYGNLSDILLAQDFQDLTGQVIQKVTQLVREVEEALVRMVVMASTVDRITGTVHDLGDDKPEVISKGEGPQMNAEQRADVVSSQDDVDDLLSSLGF